MAKTKRSLSFLLSLLMALSVFGGMNLTAYAADEVSENISLVNGQSPCLGTHYSVSGSFEREAGIHVYFSSSMTINARKGETITKVVLSYNWGNNKGTLSTSAGTFDGNATISDINAQQVTISSSSTAGVKISAVTVYFEGSHSNPTVTLTGGANAKSSGGLLTQNYLPGAMDTVTYTALTGAAFPEFENFAQNGVTVERTSDTVVTISGTPTANTAITVPDAVPSSKIVTWGSSIINDSGRNGLAFQIDRNNSYSDTANGIMLTKSGSGYAFLDYGDWMISGDVTLNFSTATGKFTSIEIEIGQIYDGGNWTKDGNKLKWNGTPSNSVSLSGSRLYLEGVSSINFVIEMPADLSTATVTLGADNSVFSVTVGGNEIIDLSEFDITYGTDESHTATEPPTEDGTYYAYVAAKSTSENYMGTAKSAAFVVAAKAQVWQSVTIADQILINFLLDTSAHANMQSITITYTNHDKEVENTVYVDVNDDLVIDEATGFYRVPAVVAPAQIGDTVTITIAKMGATPDTYSTSIADYCKYLLDGDFSAEVKALAKATLEYGQAANDYFATANYYHESDITTITNAVDAAKVAEAKDLENHMSVNANGKIQSISYMAVTKPEFRFYVNPESGLTEADYVALNDKITVNCDNANVLEKVSVQFVKNIETGAILLEVTGIEAATMDAIITITIDGFGTITFCGNDFARLLAKNASTQTLGTALYLYGTAAKACFA